MHVCPEWTAELDLYLDGELAADDRRRLHAISTRARAAEAA